MGLSSFLLNVQIFSRYFYFRVFDVFIRKSVKLRVFYSLFIWFLMI